MIRTDTVAALSATLIAGLAVGQDREPPRRWDQARAIAKVEAVLEVERAGRPWKDIAWQTDAETAATLAQQQGKPILVYFFLRKQTGPADAPC